MSCKRLSSWCSTKVGRRRRDKAFVEFYHHLERGAARPQAGVLKAKGLRMDIQVTGALVMKSVQSARAKWRALTV